VSERVSMVVSSKLMNGGAYEFLGSKERTRRRWVFRFSL